MLRGSGWEEEWSWPGRLCSKNNHVSVWLGRNERGRTAAGQLGYVLWPALLWTGSLTVVIVLSTFLSRLKSSEGVTVALSDEMLTRPYPPNAGKYENAIPPDQMGVIWVE
jgi:hypothetical protein